MSSAARAAAGAGDSMATEFGGVSSASPSSSASNPGAAALGAAGAGNQMATESDGSSYWAPGTWLEGGRIIRGPGGSTPDGKIVEYVIREPDGSTSTQLYSTTTRKWLPITDTLGSVIQSLAAAGAGNSMATEFDGVFFPATGQGSIGSSSSSSSSSSASNAAAAAAAAGATAAGVARPSSWLTIDAAPPPQPTTLEDIGVEDSDINIVLHRQFTGEEAFAGEGYSETLKPILIAGKMGFVGKRWTSIPFEHRKHFFELATNPDATPQDPYWKTPAGEKEAAYYKSDEGKAALSNMKDPTKILKELTDLVTEVASPAVAQCLAKKGGIREFFEKTGAKEQCEVVLKEQALNTYTPPCWICGYNVDIRIRLGKAETAQWYYPECEHVFPIAQAICFTGLYEGPLARRMRDTENVDESPSGTSSSSSSASSSSSTSSSSSAAAAAPPFTISKKEYIDALKPEYSWAHRICNQVKNDSHFIEYTTDTAGNGQFIISEKRIDEFLTRLLKNDNTWGQGMKLYETVKGKDPTIKEVADWKNQRVVAIANVCRPILTLAAKSGLTPSEQSQVAAMSILSTISTSAECAGAQLMDPPVRMPPGSPAVLNSVLLTYESARMLTQGVIFYVLQGPRFEELFGKIGKLFVTNRRYFSGIEPVYRDKISAWLFTIVNPGDVKRNRRLADVAHRIANTFLKEDNIELIRNQVLQHVQSFPDKTQHWSQFQASFVQVLIAFVFMGIGENIRDLIWYASRPVSITTNADINEFNKRLFAFLSHPSVIATATQWGNEYKLELNKLFNQIKTTNNIDYVGQIRDNTTMPSEVPDWFVPRDSSPKSTTIPRNDATAVAIMSAPLSVSISVSNMNRVKRFYKALYEQASALAGLLDRRNLDIQTIGVDLGTMNQFIAQNDQLNADKTGKKILKALNILSRSVPRRRGGRLRTYRKPKRATSSLRTRRARHSGLSKRLKKRSSRKSRTGKLMKRTRY